jgi:hypothetical protein
MLDDADKDEDRESLLGLSPVAAFCVSDAKAFRVLLRRLNPDLNPLTPLVSRPLIVLESSGVSGGGTTGEKEGG